MAIILKVFNYLMLYVLQLFQVHNLEGLCNLFKNFFVG